MPTHFKVRFPGGTPIPYRGVTALFVLFFLATIALSFWIPRHYTQIWTPVCPVGMRFKGYGVVYVSKAGAGLFYASFWGAITAVLASVVMLWHYVSTGQAAPWERKTTQTTQLKLSRHE